MQQNQHIGFHATLRQFPETSHEGSVCLASADRDRCIAGAWFAGLNQHDLNTIRAMELNSSLVLA